MATEAEVIRCARAYLDGHPLRPDRRLAGQPTLAGLSPMLVQAATGDARVADAEALAARARAQGVDVQLELYPVDAHAFQLFSSSFPRPPTRSRQPVSSFRRSAQARQRPAASRGVDARAKDSLDARRPRSRLG